MNIKKVIDVWVSQVSIQWVLKVKNLNTERGLGDLSQHRCMNIRCVGEPSQHTMDDEGQKSEHRKGSM